MTIPECNGCVPGNIQRIISEKGYKQNAIARRAGLTDQQLSDIIKGRRIIKVSDVTALAAALGVGIPDIYDTPADAHERRYK